MRKQIAYLSLTRALACLDVVFLHASLCAIAVFSPEAGQHASALLLTDSMLWTVPCFVMVTGALLLDPEHEVTIRKIATKYLKRVVLALIVFTFVFELFDTLVGGGDMGRLVVDWLVALFTGKTWLHMWYIYMLIGMYLMLPVFRAAVKAMDDTTLRYAIAVLAVFQALVPSIDNFLGDNQIGFYIPVNTVYPLYLLLGYAVRTGKLRLSAPGSVALAVVAEAAVMMCSHFGYASANTAVLALGNSFGSILVVAVGLGVFSLLSHVPNPADDAHPGPAMRAMLSIDRCSFGIYLMHVLALYTIYKVLAFDPFLHGDVLAIAGCALVAFIVSYAVVWVLKLIPGVRAIL